MNQDSAEVLAYQLIMSVANKDQPSVAAILNDINDQDGKWAEVCLELAAAVVKVYAARGSSVVDTIQSDFLFLLDKPQS